MQPTLKIEIGAHSFTSREISIGKMADIISAWLDEMGIPIELEVSLTGKADFLTINDQTCWFSESLINEVNAHVALLANLHKAASNDDIYWKLLVTNILWLQPALLLPNDLSPELMPALKSLPADKLEESRQQFREIIVELFSLKISLRNKSLLAEISNKYLDNPTVDWSEFREELIESLSTPAIGAYFNRNYFEQVITTGQTENLFAMMRDGLFYETGIKYRPFRIYFDDSLPYHLYYFTINSFTSIPWAGFDDPSDLFVNDVPDRLMLLGINGREAINPANDKKAGIINRQGKEAAEKAGLTTWDATGYFILGFSRFLRKHGYVCIGKKYTEDALAKIKAIYPETVELIERSNMLSICAKTLRLLAKEEISVRNLRTILEAIVESDYIIADGNRYIIFDERIPVHPDKGGSWKNSAENIVEFVRTRLKRYISHKYTSGQATLNVYLLAPEIEQFFNLPGSLPDEDFNRINNAFRNEIGTLYASLQSPVILTTVNVRPHLKKIIEPAFPQVAVLSYQELSPDMNIQPIARIALG